MNANILVVDDTPANLHLLVKLLSEHGYKVRPAPGGKHALAVAQTGQIDLVLLDIMMPGMDGYEVCRQFKAQDATRDIPIIFLSALNDTFDKVKAFELGGVDYITKPFQAEEVLARVHTHLSIRKLQHELEARNRELAELVNIDGLTQIANRRYFDDCLQVEWRRLMRERQHIALLFLDIDFFKAYNDYYGHQAGDGCLKRMARVFQESARRPADVVARYGGEEFVVLLPNTDERGAYHIAGDIQDALQQLHIPHARSSVSSAVTCSIGIACMIPDPAVTMEQFVASADGALYQAKARGRNQIAAASEPNDNEV